MDINSGKVPTADVAKQPDVSSQLGHAQNNVLPFKHNKQNQDTLHAAALLKSELRHQGESRELTLRLQQLMHALVTLLDAHDLKKSAHNNQAALQEIYTEMAKMSVLCEQFKQQILAE